MKRAAIITGIVIIVLLIGGGTFYMFGGLNKIKDLLGPKNQAQQISVEGKVICLPRKNNSDVTTLACAIGLQSTAGKYYGLSSSKNVELSEAAGTDKKIKVSGELQPQNDDTYKMEGIIAVSNFSFVK